MDSNPIGEDWRGREGVLACLLLNNVGVDGPLITFRGRKLHNSQLRGSKLHGCPLDRQLHEHRQGNWHFPRVNICLPGPETGILEHYNSVSLDNLVLWPLLTVQQ